MVPESAADCHNAGVSIPVLVHEEGCCEYVLSGDIAKHLRKLGSDRFDLVCSLLESLAVEAEYRP